MYSIWGWDEIDLEWWHRESRVAITDQAGAFRLEAAPVEEGARGSVLWISKAGFAPRFEVLPPDTSDLAGRRFELEPLAPLRVRVLQPDGSAVQGASVEISGVELGDGADVDATLHVPLLYRRTATTDAEGAALVPSFTRRQALRARLGDLVSPPKVVSSDRSDVVLQLGQTFQAEGTVTRLSSEALGGELIPRITFSALQGTIWTVLGTAMPHGETESWGPIDLPCIDATTYRVVVHGVGIIPNETRFAPPVPGAKLRFDLEAEEGTTLWFFVQNEDGEPIPYANVAVRWQEDDGRILNIDARGRPDGYVLAMGIRPGVVSALVSARGYVSNYVSQYELPLPEPAAVPVTLARAARISGRVTQNGEPVRDFEITTWPGRQTVSARPEVFRDREDGSFLIEDAPIGAVGIVAASPGSAGSDPVQLDVSPQGVESVELDLLPLIVGRGRVVDGDTGEPVADALVQPYVIGGNGSPVGAWGPSHPLKADGSFELTAFRPGDNFILVFSKTYGNAPIFTTSSEHEVDFGVIELHRRFDLRIEVATSNPKAETSYHLSARGPERFAIGHWERVSESLIARTIPNLSQGRYHIWLTVGDNAEIEVVPTVGPKNNVLRFDGGDAQIRVRVYAEGRDLPLGTEVVLKYDSSIDDTSLYWVAPLPASHEHLFKNVPSGRIRIDLRRGDDRFAETDIVARSGEETIVDLRVGGAALTIRVLGPEEVPLSSAWIQLWGLAGGQGNVHAELTNPEGIATFGALEAGTYLVHLSHPTHGLLSDVEITLAADEEVERVFTLDSTAALNLELLDGDLPIPGLACKLVDKLGHNVMEPAATDASGHVLLPRLAPATYQLEVSGPTIWPLSAKVTASKDPAVQSLQVRRVGDLVLRVVDAQGSPVSGAAVALEYASTTESVAGWIAAGRLPADTSLITNTHGEIKVTGVPHGAYHWGVLGTQGTLSVPPGKPSSAVAMLSSSD